MERRHNNRFKVLLDIQMPDWRSRRDLLNRLPLGQENWKLRSILLGIGTTLSESDSKESLFCMLACYLLNINRPISVVV